jgi:hypothetical protein
LYIGKRNREKDINENISQITSIGKYEIEIINGALAKLKLINKERKI